MIRKLVLIGFYLFGVLFSHAQNDKELEVFFLKGKKNVEDVEYYMVKGEEAYLLDRKNNKISIPSEYSDESEELKLLATFGNKKLEFFIKPNEAVHLKINKMSFSFRYLFRRMYVINQGFDHEEIVGLSKREYNFNE